MRQYKLLLFLLYFSGVSLSGESLVDKDSIKDRIPLNMSFWYHHGYLLPHHPSITYFTNENINGVELSVSRYFPEIYKLRPPQIGAGYYFSNLGNSDVYGVVHGLYTSVSGEYFKGKSPFWLQQTTSFGVSYNSKIFDISENSFNRTIGSHLNAFLIFSMDVRTMVSENILLSVGPSFVHMSNGNIRMPNFGINLITTHVGMTYNFNSGIERRGGGLPVQVTNYRNSYIIMVSAGSRQLSRKIPEQFLVGSLIAEYTRSVGNFYAAGFGLDLIMDATEGRETYVTGERTEEIIPWHAGIHLSWERSWNRLTFSFQPGYKVYTPSEHKSYQYNRLAIRYRVHENVVLNCAIKAHGVRADFIEFGFGYKGSFLNRESRGRGYSQATAIEPKRIQ